MSNKNLKVCLRVRPLNERESGKATQCVIANTAASTLTFTKPSGLTFTFDHVAGPNSKQREIFEFVGRPVTDSVIEGYNGCIFAYGQTGSGKTHTISGPDSAKYEEERGLLPRVLEYLFAHIAQVESDESRSLEYLCKVSYLEIYNEHIYDLLDASVASGEDRFDLLVRESMKRGVYVDGLNEETVNSAAEAMDIMRRGNANRSVGCTAMNRSSSRSHAVFTLVLESEEKDNGLTRSRVSRFHLIDLAGSERLKNTNVSEGKLQTEAKAINKSLSALGNVIKALADISSGKKRHIPYRDSRLTFLLRDSLGGNSCTSLIATVSPADSCRPTTLSTLKFAQRAKNVRNRAIVNEDTEADVARLQAEIKMMRQKLEEQKRGNERCDATRAPTASVKEIESLWNRLKATLSMRDRAIQRAESAEKLNNTYAKQISGHMLVTNLLRARVSHPEMPSTPRRDCLRSEVQALTAMNKIHPDAVRWRGKFASLERRLTAFVIAAKAETTPTVLAALKEVGPLLANLEDLDTKESLLAGSELPSIVDQALAESEKACRIWEAEALHLRSKTVQQRVDMQAMMTMLDLAMVKEEALKNAHEKLTMKLQHEHINGTFSQKLFLNCQKKDDEVSSTATNIEAVMSAKRAVGADELVAKVKALADKNAARARDEADAAHKILTGNLQAKLKAVEQERDRMKFRLDSMEEDQAGFLQAIFCFSCNLTKYDFFPGNF